jgi:hypothetical protein
MIVPQVVLIVDCLWGELSLESLARGAADQREKDHLRKIWFDQYVKLNQIEEPFFKAEKTATRASI